MNLQLLSFGKLLKIKSNIAENMRFYSGSHAIALSNQLRNKSRIPKKSISIHELTNMMKYVRLNQTRSKPTVSLIHSTSKSHTKPSKFTKMIIKQLPLFKLQQFQRHKVNVALPNSLSKTPSPIFELPPIKNQILNKKSLFNLKKNQLNVFKLAEGERKKGQMKKSIDSKFGGVASPLHLQDLFSSPGNKKRYEFPFLGNQTKEMSKGQKNAEMIKRKRMQIKQAQQKVRADAPKKEEETPAAAAIKKTPEEVKSAPSKKVPSELKTSSNDAKVTPSRDVKSAAGVKVTDAAVPKLSKLLEKPGSKRAASDKNAYDPAFVSRVDKIRNKEDMLTIRQKLKNLDSFDDCNASTKNFVLAFVKPVSKDVFKPTPKYQNK